MSKLKYINIILILALFPLIGLITKDYLVLRYSPAKKEPPRQAAPAAAPHPDLQAYAPIVERAVFPSSVRELKRIDIVDSMDLKGGQGISSALSELKLLGTYSGDTGYAVFEKAGTAQEVFKVGDKVFDAGVIKEIAPEKVIISTGSRDVTFSVFKEDIPPGLSMMGAEAKKETAPKQSIGAPSRMSKKITESEWVISQDAVMKSLENMSSVLTDARLTPRVSKGAIDGFLVTEIKPRGVFDAIGLVNGDVLTRINGYEIDSPEKAVQVLSALKGETSIELDIVREGQKRSFHYEIR